MPNQSIGYKLLHENHDANGFLEKFEIDKQIEKSEKDLFLQHLSTYDSSKNGDILNYVREYLYKKKLIGNKGNFKKNSDEFTRIRTIDSLKLWIKELTGFEQNFLIDCLLDDEESIDERMEIFEDILNLEITEDILNDADKSEECLGVKAKPYNTMNSLRIAKTQRFIEWSFVHNLELTKIEKRELNNLVCRAGLSATINKKNLIYNHSLETKKVYNPTVFDAGFYDVFLPGGFTQPLEPCKEEDGLNEFVHEANLFQNFIPLPIKLDANND
jgi:hypothetical protein